MRRFANPVRRVKLSFRHHDQLHGVEEPVRTDLSAAAAIGTTLFVANDELVGVERLISEDSRDTYGHHQPFRLHPMFDLPELDDGQPEEMDIEGLAVDGGYLWIVGSHSNTRKSPKLAKKGPQQALERLRTVRHHANRHFLGRVPLIEGEAQGRFEPVEQTTDPDGRQRRCGALKMTKKGSRLDEVLEDDKLLGPFMDVPAKENGFDIEGIAVRGERVFLGLRGPVLRGIAVILELQLKETAPGRLKPAKLGNGERYRRHLLDLDGLGIRDLRFDRDTLLILAGPTMDLSGPMILFRWQDPLAHGEGGFVLKEQLARVLDLPHGEGEDHAEGICRLPDPETGELSEELLVIYDSPAAARLRGHGLEIDADVFQLPLPLP